MKIRTPEEKQRARENNLYDSLKAEIRLALPTEPEPLVWMRHKQILDQAKKLPIELRSEFASFVCNYFENLTRFKEREIFDAIRPKGKRGKSVPEATKDDYIALWREVLGDIKRDIFSRKMLWQDSDGIWKAALNEVDRVEVRSHEHEQEGKCAYRPRLVKKYLHTLQNASTPVLIPEIPEWDKRDRIGEMAVCVKLVPQAGIEPWAFEYLLKDWFARAFRRLREPHEEQNRILVLQGGEGVGKDTWIDTLVGGLGQWAIDLSVIAHDKDTFLQLNRAMVLKISEFDKTNKVDTSLIKDIITRATTNVRAAYAHDSEYRLCRCSFIASCNPKEILRESGRNRRFLIFEVDKIDWSYGRTDADKSQILAQASELAKSQYPVLETAEAAMRAYLDEVKPEDVAEEIEEMWTGEASAWLSENITLGLDIQSRGWFTIQEARPILEKIRKMTGYSHKFISGKLKLRGWHRRDKISRGIAVPKTSF